MAAKGKHAAAEHVLAPGKCHAETWDRAEDLQIFSLTLSQLSYRGSVGYGRSLGLVIGGEILEVGLEPQSPP